MKAMLAVTLVLDVKDRDDADVVRARVLEALRADEAVAAASAPFPVVR